MFAYSPEGNEGLGLDSDGVTRPPINQEKSRQPNGADSLTTAQGMEAGWPRQTKNGSVHDSPAQRLRKTPNEEKKTIFQIRELIRITKVY